VNSPVLLSAGIPSADSSKYEPEPDLIRQAILALIAVALPYRKIVFGGHPAISPLVELAAINIGAIDNVCIFQSRLFKDVIPQEAKNFQNLHWTRVIKKSNEIQTKKASLTEMRKKMIQSESFGLAIFIGGMEGIEEEWDLFGQCHAGKPRIPIASTKGAAMLLWQKYEATNKTLESELRYRTLFRKHLQ
jgi:hypothetical protein